MRRYWTMYTQAVSQTIKKEKVHEYERANKQIGFCFLVPNSSKKIDAGANEHIHTMCQCTSVTATSQREISCKCSSYGLIRQVWGFILLVIMCFILAFSAPSIHRDLWFSNKQHLQSKRIYITYALIYCSFYYHKPINLGIPLTLNYYL